MGWLPLSLGGAGTALLRMGRVLRIRMARWTSRTTSSMAMTWGRWTVASHVMRRRTMAVSWMAWRWTMTMRAVRWRAMARRWWTSVRAVIVAGRVPMAAVGRAVHARRMGMMAGELS